MKRFFLLLLLAALALGAFLAWYGYELVTAGVTAFRQDEKAVFISTPLSIDSLAQQLAADSVITSPEHFQRVAGWKKFTKAKPGRYVVTQGMSHNSIINKLRSGDQDPVRVTFNSTRTVEELASRVGAQIAADSADLVFLLRNPNTAAEYGFTEAAFKSMFIPNTYEFWWDTDAVAFVDRMKKEYDAFWTQERRDLATSLNLTLNEVTTLASIVHAETAKRDEAPVVAGLYLNRLRIGMALQADPTLIYAHQDFSIRRVLNIHKEIDSPYNTYKYPGLPPGPINFPDPNYIDAVLKADKHNYVFMCAKADFSGYHNFSRTLDQHNAYAREYQRALNNQ
jgi:UPF0755 protein